jgi:hypothetical protein
MSSDRRIASISFARKSKGPRALLQRSSAADDLAAELPNELSEAYNISAEASCDNPERHSLLHVKPRILCVLLGASTNDLEHDIDVIFADGKAREARFVREARLELLEDAMVQVKILAGDLGDGPGLGVRP